jgi:hypothetical protein
MFTSYVLHAHFQQLNLLQLRVNRINIWQKLCYYKNSQIATQNLFVNDFEVFVNIENNNFYLFFNCNCSASQNLATKTVRPNSLSFFLSSIPFKVRRRTKLKRSIAVRGTNNFFFRSLKFNSNKNDIDEINSQFGRGEIFYWLYC